MQKLTIISFRQFATVCCLIAIVGILTPAKLMAAAPSGSEETCGECHEAETEAWLNSPHATSIESEGATCEGCHGLYVEDHPEAGIMQLTIDSSSCEECHATTVDEWRNTTHAEADVQCIGCHMSHSQSFRLTDQNKCGACHQERQQDFTFTSHDQAGVGCVDCHASAPVEATNLSFISTHSRPQKVARSHDFTHVSKDDCIECHTEDAHEGLPATDADHVENVRLKAQADSVPVLSAKLQESKSTNQSLLMLTPISLGLGIGIGGAMGIVSIMLFCFINQKRAQQ